MTRSKSGSADDTVGIFGLGLIGTAVAIRLLDHGQNVTGHDTDATRMQALRDAGGEAAGPGAVWQSQTVIAAVFDTDQLSDVIDSATNREPVRLIALSTCDPDRMPALGLAAESRGIDLVEAPISGTSRQLASGGAVLLVGGTAQAVAGSTPLFKMLARAYYHVGGLGDGNRAKLAINLILGLNRAALAEGLVFAESLGLDPAKFLALAQKSAAASQVMQTKGPLMVTRDFAPQGRIAQSAKDFRLITDAALAHGQRLPFAETYLSMMQNCIDHGEDGLDNAAIIRALSRSRTKGRA